MGGGGGGGVWLAVLLYLSLGVVHGLVVVFTAGGLAVCIGLLRTEVWMCVCRSVVCSGVLYRGWAVLGGGRSDKYRKSVLLNTPESSLRSQLYFY